MSDSERAQALESALREIVEDLEARWDMSDPGTNPGIRDNVTRARGLLSAKDHLCDGCLCSVDACAAYRKAGKICCPDCDHMRRPQPDEKGHLPTCSSWRCAWEWSTADGAGVCRLPRGSEIHYIGTVDSHAFMALPCDCVPASLSPVKPTPPEDDEDDMGPLCARCGFGKALHFGEHCQSTRDSLYNPDATFLPVEPAPPPPAPRPQSDAEKAEAMVEQLNGNIARQAGWMLAQDEKIVALRAEIERLSAKYNDAHLRALKAESGSVEPAPPTPAPCVWRVSKNGLYADAGCRESEFFETLSVSEWRGCPYCLKPLEITR